MEHGRPTGLAMPSSSFKLQQHGKKLPSKKKSLQWRIYGPVDNVRSSLPNISDVRQMPHCRPSMRTIPGLIHGPHMLHDLHISKLESLELNVEQNPMMYRCHLIFGQWHAHHNALPARSHCKHSSCFRAPNHLTGWPILHQVKKFLEICRTCQLVNR